jgi:hypothetical protein
MQLANPLSSAIDITLAKLLNEGGVMQAFQTSSLVELAPLPAYRAATEPVGGVNSSIPLHPDDHPPGFNERKRQKERAPPPGNSGGDADKKPPDPEHQIDEYACPVQTGGKMIL